MNLEQNKFVERRQHQRFPITIQLAEVVTIESPQLPSGPHQAILIDLSAGGMGLATVFPLPVGTVLNLNLNLKNLSLQNVSGKVVWSTNRAGMHHQGISFEKIDAAAQKLLKAIAADYQECEKKIAENKKAICFAACHYYPFCFKKIKKNF